MIQVWDLFVPIAGKAYCKTKVWKADQVTLDSKLFTDANPDILIALICVLWTVLCLSYLVRFFENTWSSSNSNYFIPDTADDPCEVSRGFVLSTDRRIHCVTDSIIHIRRRSVLRQQSCTEAPAFPSYSYQTNFLRQCWVAGFLWGWIFAVNHR